MRYLYLKGWVLSCTLGLVACDKTRPVDKQSNSAQSIEQAAKVPQNLKKNEIEITGKPVIYQMMTRLFGNQNNTNKPWGTKEENGVGKFNDITPVALEALKKMGVTHVWYTGILHHGVIADYQGYGISLDDPDVFKGRAGSPYAIKDYFNVNPDLALDPAKRMEEFEALVARSHEAGLKVIIDIIPNHVARNYQSISNPEGVTSFGAEDDKTVEYKRDNNFYYILGESFKVPEFSEDNKVLGGEAHPLADGKFEETPAKWTGNGARKAQPDVNDWYETVKLNYGVKPDGSYDFERLPEAFKDKHFQAHYDFWKDKSVPNTWIKFKEITQFWLSKGVNGFRYDVAELVPVEFWSYLNSQIKVSHPDTVLVAEVYNPKMYRDFIQLGLMDVLYDKVGFYDSLKLVMQGKEKASALVDRQEEVADIESYMLHFLENHDEQRIASPDFAGDAKKGMPAMVVSSLISRSPNLLYFGQDVGVAGEGDAGFGDPTRTTIFDYWGVPAHQRWMNQGNFDGGQLKPEEASLKAFYDRLMTYSSKAKVLKGQYQDLHRSNLASSGYSEKQFSFARWDDSEALLVIANFDDQQSSQFDLTLPKQLARQWNLKEGNYSGNNLFDDKQYQLSMSESGAKLPISLKPLESKVIRLSLPVNTTH